MVILEDTVYRVIFVRCNFLPSTLANSFGLSCIRTNRVVFEEILFETLQYAQF